MLPPRDWRGPDGGSTSSCSVPARAASTPLQVCTDGFTTCMHTVSGPANFEPCTFQQPPSNPSDNLLCPCRQHKSPQIGAVQQPAITCRAFMGQFCTTSGSLAQCGLQSQHRPAPPKTVLARLRGAIQQPAWLRRSCHWDPLQQQLQSQTSYSRGNTLRRWACTTGNPRTLRLSWHAAILTEACRTP